MVEAQHVEQMACYLYTHKTTNIVGELICCLVMAWPQHVNVVIDVNVNVVVVEVWGRRRRRRVVMVVSEQAAVGNASALGTAKRIEAGAVEERMTRVAGYGDLQLKRIDGPPVIAHLTIGSLTLTQLCWNHNTPQYITYHITPNIAHYNTYHNTIIHHSSHITHYITSYIHILHYIASHHNALTSYCNQSWSERGGGEGARAGNVPHCDTYFTFDDMVDKRPRDVAQIASQLASEGHHQVLQRVQFCVQCV